jgi:TolB-like protein/DNA-binding winged helix-turn-helix (wHTH) protein/Tfp pilus assembly protein PilF
MSEPESHVIYEFGDFRLDATRRLLFASGNSNPLPITTKVFETLLYLVEHQGELLEKDKLIAELWPGLIVEESSLTHVISVLRHVLGETRGENRYLATVHGRGYRFVADVVRVREEPKPFPAMPAFEPATPASSASPRTQRLRLFLLAVCVLGLVIGYGRYAHWWQVRDGTLSPAAGTTSATSQLPARSVAVLPFQNLSIAPQSEFFAVGLAESILHQLASLSQIEVIAGTSSFAFKGRSQDAREVGRMLNARYLLEGSVQSGTDQLRVTAQLIDATTGGHVWSMQFDRKPDNVFAVQDEIAREVARALGVSLDPATTQRLAGHGTTNLDAYLAFVRARVLMSSRKIADAKRAIESLSTAIRLDPNFAAAYAAQADAVLQLGLLSDSNEGAVHRQASQAAKPLVAKALELDPNVAQAYLVRASLEGDDHDVSAADADFRRAIALNPNYGTAFERYADFVSATWPDRYEEALALSEQARRIDPLTPRNHHLKALLLLKRGDVEEAEALFVQALELAPDFHPSLMRLGTSRYMYGGHFAEAVKYAEQAITIDPQAPWLREGLVDAYLELEDSAAAKQTLEQLSEQQPGMWLPIHLYEKELNRAAQIAFADPSHPEQNSYYCDLLAYAVRDQALASGGLEKASRYIEDLVRKDAGGQPLVYVTNQNQVLALAQLRFAMGDHERASTLARAVLDWQEREAKNFRKHQLERQRGVALALLGRKEQALQALENGFASGYRTRWWYLLERDPALAQIRNEPRFQALLVEARAHAAAQRSILNEMRRAGLVPNKVPI